MEEMQKPTKLCQKVHAFDAQLARLLGDPRKPKTGGLVLLQLAFALLLRLVWSLPGSFGFFRLLGTSF